MVPCGSIGFNVLSVLAIRPMTFDEIKVQVVADFVYVDFPGLRRKIAKAVYEMCRHGYAAKRGLHLPDGFAKYRRWQITPAGQEAIDGSMTRYYATAPNARPAGGAT